MMTEHPLTDERWLSNMEVIIVIGGWDDEGDDFDSLRVFHSMDKARDYEYKLTLIHDRRNTGSKDADYDYAKVERRTIT
jgi:hypothetical protein